MDAVRGKSEFPFLATWNFHLSRTVSDLRAQGRFADHSTRRLLDVNQNSES